MNSYKLFRKSNCDKLVLYFLYIYTPATMHTHTHTRKRARACAYIVQVCKWTLLAEMRFAHYPAPLLWLLTHKVRSVTLPIYGER